jgi:holin-like protein
MSTIDLRAIGLTSRRRLRRSRLAQVALILALWGASAGVVHVLGLPIPAGILGLAVTLLLLATRRLSLFAVRRGAAWFVGDMMLFFVPAVVSVLDHPEFLGRLGLAVLIVIVLSTLVVMAVTAMTVELIHAWRLRHDRA